MVGCQPCGMGCCVKHTDMSLLWAITHDVAVAVTPWTLTSSPTFFATCHWTRIVPNSPTTG